MTFEDWADIYDCAEENSRMLADWKAEREKLIGALEEIEAMGGMTLLGDQDFPGEDKAHQVGANKAFGQAATVAHAVLAEVKEKV